MATEGLLLNRAIVLGFSLLYWAGVWVQVRRVRRRIGRSPNVRPRGLKEKLLWAGWTLVVVAWLALPFLTGTGTRLPGSSIIQPLMHPAALVLGAILMGVGYGGTLWCYVALGDAWRMGVARKESPQLVTRGPYRFVRHPLYLCQLVMGIAIVLLLPSGLSLTVLGVHLVCVLTKARDEEAHLQAGLGQSYEAYRARTGAWFPPLLRGKSAAPPQSGAARVPQPTRGQNSK